MLEEDVIKIKECHEIRWLAFYKAVEAVYKSYHSLVTFFRKYPSAKGKRSIEPFLAMFLDYRFVYMLHCLMDILPAVAQVSMILQKQEVDIASVASAISGLKDTIKISKKGNGYHHKLFSEKIIKRRNEKGVLTEILFKQVKLTFTKATTKEASEVRVQLCDNLCKNVGVLAMRSLSFMSDEERQEYGNKELELLIQHYSEERKVKEVTSPLSLTQRPAGLNGRCVRRL